MGNHIGRRQPTSGHDVLFGDDGDNNMVGYGPPVPGHAPWEGWYLAVRGDAADALFGQGGNDTLDGGGGNDALFGGAGADVLVGSLGADWLFGQGGADVFRFGWFGPWREADTGLGLQRDVVMDFRPGEDRLDLAGYANLVTPGIAFIGTAAPQDTWQTQVGYHFEGACTVVDIYGFNFGAPPGTPPTDVDFSRPTAQIVLMGHYNLTPWDLGLAWPA